MRYRRQPVPAAQLEPIAQLAQSVANAGSLQEVFRAVFLFAVSTSPADGIIVSLYDRDRGMRRCVYLCSVVVGEDGRRVLEEETDPGLLPELPLNEGPQSRAIADARLVHTDDLVGATGDLTVVGSGTDFDERPPRSSVAVPLITGGRVLGAFEIQSTELAAFRIEHHAYLEMSANLAAIAVRDIETLSKERAQHEATLRALGLALEYRDLETKGHTDRVVTLSEAFGRVLALDAPAIQALRWGAYLHDLGKVAIPDDILLKPGRLTEAEFERVKQHPDIGSEMCREIPFLPRATRHVVLHHHERWDGTGYPSGLSDETIPYLARMFTLVDVYDALTHVRPYKAAWTHEAAAAELTEMAGRQFDPALVEPFLRVAEAFGHFPEAATRGTG